jgi:tRNA guanosine-2'-O-methyltransferase
LANLTRTCEIFGVSELVIPNKEVIEDEAFRNIAVTAEKWIPLVEVKENDLLGFLIMKKKLGYMVQNFLFFFELKIEALFLIEWILVFF